MAKHLQLSNGSFVLVDDDDYEELSKHVWTEIALGYALRRRKSGEPGDATKIRLHRAIAKAPKGAVVDHANGDTRDCRKSNLRVCRQRDNTRNRLKKRTSTVPYKGIARTRGCSTWRARITVDGQYIEQSGFQTPEAAAKAYDEMATKYFGEFARLNFNKEKINGS